MKQETIALTRGDGSHMHSEFFLPDSVSRPVPAIVVIFDIFGMTADLSRIAGRFTENGYAVIIPNLYDHPEPRMMCMMRALRSSMRGSGREFEDIELARGYLRGRPEVDAQRIAITGFCLGGGFAVLLAARGAYRVSAPFYGEVPKDIQALRGACPVVGSYGGRDAGRMVEAGKRLESFLTTLGVPHDVKFYPEAGHSFMNRNTGFWAEKIAPRLPMHAAYDHPASEDAWQRIFAFFEKHLSSPV
ncbi:MAG TPA: dienelactone hydrolase family protein [Candidatus Acidoferrales bacterium]|nr:dienelactone hydrolase family protein [Candidatus Acidoferrales bacterium]